MSQDLRGKVALVTGAGSGIGRAMARAVAAEGMRVALVGRSADRLTAVADEIEGETLVAPADLTRPDELNRAVAQTIARFGGIDVLLPNAGIYIPGDVAEGDPNAWDELIAINVSSVFRLVRCVLPGQRKQGHIIVTSSISGHQAIYPNRSIRLPNMPSVFRAWTRRQVARYNIRVGEVSPGVVRTSCGAIGTLQQLQTRSRRMKAFAPRTWRKP